jgi:hypothetical protein
VSDKPRPDPTSFPEKELIMSDIKIPVPAWTIVNEERHADVGLPTSTAVLQDPTFGIKHLLPFFSSEDLASTFIAQTKGQLDGHAPLKLETVGQIRDLLVSVSAAAAQDGGPRVGLELEMANGKIYGKTFSSRLCLEALDEMQVAAN